MQKVKAIAELSKQGSVVIITNYESPKKKNVHALAQGENPIPLIYYYLKSGVNVIYQKYWSTAKNGIALLNKYTKKDIQFMAANVNATSKNIDIDYSLKLDFYQPVVFSNSSEILTTLVGVSKNFKDFEQNFNTSYDFISRITCKWIN